MSDMYVCAQETAALLYGDRPWPNVIAPLEKQAARIEELEAAIDEAIEYVAGHDDEWPKALAVRLRAARAAMEKKND
jgi:hypothetical protein